MFKQFLLSGCALLLCAHQALAEPMATADEAAVRQLLADYAWAADARNPDEIAGLFQPEGQLHVPLMGKSVTGREQISTLFAAAWAPLDAKNEQRRHVITNLRVVDTSGDGADLRAYMTIMGQAPGEAPAIRMLGYYEAEVIKSADSWLFASLTINIDKPQAK